jgi:hypothetical protein
MGAKFTRFILTNDYDEDESLEEEEGFSNLSNVALTRKNNKKK